MDNILSLVEVIGTSGKNLALSSPLKLLGFNTLVRVGDQALVITCSWIIDVKFLALGDATKERTILVPLK